MSGKELKGKTAVVTGAAQWLGWDMACALAEAGADIVITSRNREKAEEAAGKIAEEYGTASLGIALEQTDYASIEQAMEEAAAFRGGGIDILINNAGGGSGGAEGNLLKRDSADIASMIGTNLTGPIYCCKAAAPHMLGRPAGRIINIASVAALVGRDRDLYRRTGKMEQPVDYAAAKAGIIGLTQDLAAFMAPYDITVNCISPGGFDKGDLPDEFVKGYAGLTMAGRMGRFGRDIKGAALFLASDGAGYVTGQNLVVDGGFSLCR